MALKEKAWDWEAYLALGEASQEKHELVQGRLLAMAGAGRAHNLGLPSRKAYLLLDSRERRAEGYFREGEAWVYGELAEVALACPPVRFSLDEVYGGVL